MKNVLIELIPEFNFIEDSILKEKVLRTWEEAIKLGNWEISDLLRFPFALSIKDCPVSIIEHVRSVVQVCSESEKALRKFYQGKIKINRDYLLVGALLHDIGKLLEYKKKEGKFVKSKLGTLLSHSFSGVILCSKQGIPEEILHIIAFHSKEGEGQRKTIESKILYHADFMNFEIFCTQ